MSSQRNILIRLPEYPRTRHLSHNPNAARNDLIASEKECSIIFENNNTYLECKIDGASAAIHYDENGIFTIRNRNNILSKGKTGHLRTPAKLQFAPIYNWAYDNLSKFEKLKELSGFNYSIFGEWLYALHGIHYDKLPSYFIPYDLYDWTNGQFLDTGKTRQFLSEAEFNLPPLLHQGRVLSWAIFDTLCQEQSPFSTTDRREGVYVKVSDGKYITHRFKIIRSGFIQGEHWSNKKLTKNRLK